MSNNTERANFSEDVKLKLRIRVGGWCSNPFCECPKGIIKNGEVAHIIAASEGGPRWNPRMSYEDRKSEKNGIWLCRNCHDDVDDKNSDKSRPVLERWKKDAINSHNKRIIKIIKEQGKRNIDTKEFNYAILAFILQTIDYLNELHEKIDKFRKDWTNIDKKILMIMMNPKKCI